MASRYYAVERGGTPAEVTSGSGTQSKTVEIAIDLADNATHAEVIAQIDLLRNSIARGPWPPA